MEEKIEWLAVEKDFAALSATEQAWVLTEMSQVEFEQLRRVLLAARQLDAGVLPSSHLKADLLQRMATTRQPSRNRQLLSAKIPVWLTALLVLLAMALISFLKKETVREKVVTQIQQRTDTLWLEKIVWRERVVLRDRVVYREKSMPKPIAVIPEKELDFEQEFQKPEFSAPHVGTSLGDAPELMRFFTQGDK